MCYPVLPEVATLVYSLANSLNFKGFIDFFKHQLVYGEPGEVRTRDPMIKSHVLFLLSYRLIYGRGGRTRTHDGQLTSALEAVAIAAMRLPYIFGGGGEIRTPAPGLAA